MWPQGTGHTLPEQPSPELVEEPSEVTTTPIQVQNVEVNLSCSEMIGVTSRVQVRKKTRLPTPRDSWAGASSTAHSTGSLCTLLYIVTCRAV